jgi:hypothetical protein
MKKLLAGGINLITQVCTLCILAAASSADAAPVVYSLQTVSDGELGTQSFKQAAVTLTFRGDTEDVVPDPSATSAAVYKIVVGDATVSVMINEKVFDAHFRRGEVFVRYDVTNGLVGFGSAISATYPVTLGCGNSNCSSIDVYSVYDGIASILASHETDVTAATLALPTGLTHSTLLTGFTQECPIPYVEDPNNQFQLLCPSVPLYPLRTDKGNFSLRDPFSWGGVQGDNYAIFTVRVRTREDREE